MNETISACLVLYNEEKFIRRCLNSLYDVVDEIVVVHDGKCSDDTLNICSDFTSKIFVRSKIGEAEPHRVFSFNKASSEWILQIDADEMLSADLKSNIKELVRRDDIDLYYFLRPFTNGYESLTLRLQYPWWPCLARKKRMKFIGFPHQQIQTTGNTEKVSLEILHRPEYDNYTWERFKSKWLDWAKIQAEWAWKSSDEIPYFGKLSDDEITEVLRKYRCNSILSIPREFLRNLSYHLYKGIWRIGAQGIRIALLRAAYEALVLYYSYKYRRSNVGQNNQISGR